MPKSSPRFFSLESLSNYMQSPFSSRSSSPTKPWTRPTTPASPPPFESTLTGALSPHRNSPTIIETHHVRRASVESPSADFDLPETWMVNQYLVVKELGSGSYGNVLLVLNTHNQTHYACKVINKRRLKRQFQFRTRGHDNSEAMTMIKQEIAILKRLSRHRNIIALIEVLNDDQEDNLYMIFDLCVGPIMKIQMNTCVDPFSEEKSLKYFRDVLLGLEFLHSQRIIHCDLKPENILLTRDDHAQISDFGVSHMCDSSMDDVMGLRQGSPPFTPPEACDPHASVVNGQALDIWCLGVTLFCFLHGRLPFEVDDGNLLDLFARIMHAEPVYAVASASAKDLLVRMLAKCPRARIPLAQIKVHAWVETQGVMLSRQENCVIIELTPEEVENAIAPAGPFSRFLHRVKKAASFRSRSPDPETKRDIASRTGSPVVGPTAQEHIDSGLNLSKQSLRKK